MFKIDVLSLVFCGFYVASVCACQLLWITYYVIATPLLQYVIKDGTSSLNWN